MRRCTAKSPISQLVTGDIFFDCAGFRAFRFVGKNLLVIVQFASKTTRSAPFEAGNPKFEQTPQTCELWLAMPTKIFRP